MGVNAAQAMVDFMHFLGGLKTVLRQGWVNRMIPARVESVADHSFRMAAFLAFSAEAIDPGANVSHCIRMALVHDVAEAVCGDITPSDGMSDKAKATLERAALMQIAEPLLAIRGREAQAEFINLWEEVRLYII